MYVYTHIYIYIYRLVLSVNKSSLIPTPNNLCRFRGKGGTTFFHPRPFVPSIKSHFWKISSTFGDKCPQNGSKNGLRAPRTGMGCPHIGPSVVFSERTAESGPLRAVHLSRHKWTTLSLHPSPVQFVQVANPEQVVQGSGQGLDHLLGFFISFHLLSLQVLEGP